LPVKHLDRFPSPVKRAYLLVFLVPASRKIILAIPAEYCAEFSKLDLVMKKMAWTFVQPEALSCWTAPLFEIREDESRGDPFVGVRLPGTLFLAGTCGETGNLTY
jgi:hypothetical protein